MKKEDYTNSKETDKNKKDHVDQNVYDFNPSQFTTEEELEKIKWKREKEKEKKEDDEKKKD